MYTPFKTRNSFHTCIKVKKIYWHYHLLWLEQNNTKTVKKVKTVGLYTRSKFNNLVNVINFFFLS